MDRTSDGEKAMRLLLKSKRGAAAAEYALILAIVGSAIALAAITLGGTIGNALNSTSTCIATKGTTC